ncbi:MAG: hypothetical protein HY075_00325 [Deltaproteobacteria bacterium]|nr:hypothetical protein [Deltaproteobacteria bacterium]
MECGKCGRQTQVRRRKPKLLSYVLFVASFLAFLVYTSGHRLGVRENSLWLAAQILLGGWAAFDRRKNATPLFYCRSCTRQLSFLTKS